MIDKRDILNPNALVIDQGDVIAAPGGNLPGPLPASDTIPPQWMDRLMMLDRAEKKKKQDQYDMEVESADRLRRMQEMDRFLAAGIAPPKQQIAEQRKPELLKSGNDIWAIDPFTGATKMLVKGPENDRVLPGYTQEDMDGVDLGDEFFFGPSNYPGRSLPFRKRQQSATDKAIADALSGSMGTTPSSGRGAAPRTPASSRYTVRQK